jgi:hypothetical protein
MKVCGEFKANLVAEYAKEEKFSLSLPSTTFIPTGSRTGNPSFSSARIRFLKTVGPV